MIQNARMRLFHSPVSSDELESPLADCCVNLCFFNASAPRPLMGNMLKLAFSDECKH